MWEPSRFLWEPSVVCGSNFRLLTQNTFTVYLTCLMDHNYCGRITVFRLVVPIDLLLTPGGSVGFEQPECSSKQSSQYCTVIEHSRSSTIDDPVKSTAVRPLGKAGHSNRPRRCIVQMTSCLSILALMYSELCEPSKVNFLYNNLTVAQTVHAAHPRQLNRFWALWVTFSCSCYQEERASGKGVIILL